MNYVLYDLSYANLILLGATLPSYNSEKSKSDRASKSNEEVINADDPNNKDKVRQFFNSVN